MRLGHLVPQVLGQNQFHGAYIKQDIKWNQHSNTWKTRTRKHQVNMWHM